MPKKILVEAMEVVGGTKGVVVVVVVVVIVVVVVVVVAVVVFTVGAAVVKPGIAVSFN